MRLIAIGGSIACLLLAACSQKTAEAENTTATPAVDAATPAAEPATASASEPAVGQKVQFAGCPANGVEAGCVVLESGGATYNVTGANPKIEIKGLGVNGEGVVSKDVSICMQGTILKDITYTYNKMKCPLAGDGKGEPSAK